MAETDPLDLLKRRKAEYNKVWRQANLEKRKEYMRQWRLAHQEELREKRKIYDQIHKNAKRERNKQWRKTHPQAQPAYKKRHRIKHRDELLLKQREYDNRPDVKARKKIASKAYREANRNQRRLRALQKRHSDPATRIRIYLRRRLRAAIARCKCAKTVSAVRGLGCTIPELLIYLAGRFQPGMSWGNYGEWHIDHIKPLSSFDLFDPAQQAAAVHYTNLQPLWALDNLVKGSRVSL